MENRPIIRPYKGKFSSILLFGPPGAGKGMLGDFLSQGGSQYHLHSTDIFKGLTTYSPAGKVYHSYAKEGRLLPDDVMIDIWKYYVHGLIATNAYHPESQDLLLDGLPRTLNQAERLDEYISVRHIIILDIADREELFRRMQKRALSEGVFEKLNLEELQRRFDIYQKEVDEVQSFYPHHLISHVDADQRPLEVLRDVLVRLSHLLSSPNRST